MIDKAALDTALTRLKAFRSAQQLAALIHEPSGLTATDLDVATIAVVILILRC
ncbi:hypothetical protein [Sphingomonas endolithica]|uniref:hypothetical protein n=1 Tax=Sphingomonas endolithica TaxID=2972485 RepID=UPI0021AFEC5C|nr:hypothetical protein [Sphingomonas sp. ZFBP2030]